LEIERGLLVETEYGPIDEGDGKHGRGRVWKGAAGENGMVGFHGRRTNLRNSVPSGIGV
jgi:hypothetical protein